MEVMIAINTIVAIEFLFLLSVSMVEQLTASRVFKLPSYADPVVECEKRYNESIYNRDHRNESHTGKLWKLTLLDEHSKFIKSGPKTLFIHIGKTGGSSASTYLHRKHIGHRRIHVFPVEWDMLSYFDHVIVSIRDPLARFVSAFNFHHISEEMIKVEHLDTPNYPFFYNCFPNISIAGEAVFDETMCGAKMREPVGHMGLGYCSYLGGRSVRDALSRHNGVYLLRQEHLEQDMRVVLNALRPNNSNVLHNKASVDYIPEIHKSSIYLGSPSKTLSNLAKENLEMFLRITGEQGLYEELLQLIR